MAPGPFGSRVSRTGSGTISSIWMATAGRPCSPTARPLRSMPCPSPTTTGPARWRTPTGSPRSPAWTWPSTGGPTVDGYLGRATKAQILDAVREAKGEASAQLIEHLKKGDMAREAERLLDGTGWLPQVLRTQGLPTPALPLADPHARDGADGSQACAMALPAFLIEDEADGTEAPAPYLTAAE